MEIHEDIAFDWRMDLWCGLAMDLGMHLGMDLGMDLENLLRVWIWVWIYRTGCMENRQNGLPLTQMFMLTGRLDNFIRPLFPDLAIYKYLLDVLPDGKSLREVAGCLARCRITS